MGSSETTQNTNTNIPQRSPAYGPFAKFRHDQHQDYEVIRAAANLLIEEVAKGAREAGIEVQEKNDGARVFVLKKEKHTFHIVVRYVQFEKYNQEDVLHTIRISQESDDGMHIREKAMAFVEFDEDLFVYKSTKTGWNPAQVIAQQICDQVNKKDSFAGLKL